MRRSRWPTGGSWPIANGATRAAPPLLLVHGAPGSRLLCPDEDATAVAGVRLLTVDRPGYGARTLVRIHPCSAGPTMSRPWPTGLVWSGSRWSGSPPAVDVPSLARTDVRDALTQMFREGARQGVDGLVADWIAPSLPWGFAFADLKLAQLQASAVPPGRASAVAAALGRDPCRGDSLSSPLTSGGSRGRSGVAVDRGFKAIGGGGEAAVAETNGFGQLPVPRRALPGPITTAMLLAPCG